MLKTALVFGDNMVIQRDRPFVIWGTASPGAAVSVNVQNQLGCTEADAKGNWIVTLEPLNASTDETVVVASGDEILEFQHAAIGEVWLAGGQSNMEFHMRYDIDIKEELEKCPNPLIRFFDYPEVQLDKELEKQDFHRFGYWRSCTAEDLEYYSAVGYYFAKRLSEGLKVPVGILACNWGGTKASCWMDEEFAQEYAPEVLEDFRKSVASISDLEQKERDYLESPLSQRTDPFGNRHMDRMMFGITPEEMAELTRELEPELQKVSCITPVHAWRPCGLFHTMLEKIIPYAVRGVLWYQGESDQDYAPYYKRMLTGLINCWRYYWNEELPFLIVQLAPLSEMAGGANFEVIRNQQESLAKTLAGIYTVPTDDVGEENNLHPRAKRPVGQRLAAMALQKIYKKFDHADAPAFHRYARIGKAIRIEFTDSSGLHTPDESAEPLVISYGGNVISKDQYHIRTENDDLIIEMDTRYTAKKLEIHFAGAGYSLVQLKNEFGLPVKPFDITV